MSIRANAALVQVRVSIGSVARQTALMRIVFKGKE